MGCSAMAAAGDTNGSALRTPRGSVCRVYMSGSACAHQSARLAACWALSPFAGTQYVGMARRLLHGPASISSVADISKWISMLDKALETQTADQLVFARPYAALRSAV